MSRGTSTVADCAPATPTPDRTASTYARYANESFSTSSSLRSRNASARRCISAASGHCLVDSSATFCTSAAAVAVTAAAADPLAGAGAFDAIFESR